MNDREAFDWNFYGSVSGPPAGVRVTQEEIDAWDWFQKGVAHARQQSGDYVMVPREPTEQTRSQKLAAAGFTRRPTWRSLPSDRPYADAAIEQEQRR